MAKPNKHQLYQPTALERLAQQLRAKKGLAPVPKKKESKFKKGINTLDGGVIGKARQTGYTGVVYHWDETGGWDFDKVAGIVKHEWMVEMTPPEPKEPPKTEAERWLDEYLEKH